jgi:hypothetical protein
MVVREKGERSRGSSRALQIGGAVLVLPLMAVTAGIS